MWARWNLAVTNLHYIDLYGKGAGVSSVSLSFPEFREQLETSLCRERGRLQALFLQNELEVVMQTYVWEVAPEPLVLLHCFSFWGFHFQAKQGWGELKVIACDRNRASDMRGVLFLTCPSPASRAGSGSEHTGSQVSHPEPSLLALLV